METNPGFPSGACPTSLPPCISFFQAQQPEQPSRSAATKVAPDASALWPWAATALPGDPTLLVSGACWLLAFPGISDRGEPNSDWCSLDHFSQWWSWSQDRRPGQEGCCLNQLCAPPLRHTCGLGGSFQPCQRASRLISDQSIAFNAEREESW